MSVEYRCELGGRDDALRAPEHHEVVGADKSSIKTRIKALKHSRDEALAAHDHGKLKTVRRHIHRLKRELHKATV
jgi:hypothetical protein